MDELINLRVCSSEIEFSAIRGSDIIDMEYLFLAFLSQKRIADQTYIEKQGGIRINAKGRKGRSDRDRDR